MNTRREETTMNPADTIPALKYKKSRFDEQTQKLVVEEEIFIPSMKIVATKDSAFFSNEPLNRNNTVKHGNKSFLSFNSPLVNTTISRDYALLLLDIASKQKAIADAQLDLVELKEQLNQHFDHQFMFQPPISESTKTPSLPK